MPSRSDIEVSKLLQDSIAATFDTLASALGCSPRTVRRALRKVGYYSSINRDSTWVTLRGTPRFNHEGLWCHGGACFSSYGTLIETVKALINDSHEGRTLEELESRVHTKAHQAVNACLSRGQIGRFYLGRYAVYVSADEEAAASQEARRLGRLETERRALRAAKRKVGELPEGLDALTIVRVLVQMLVSPEASLASLSRTLQAQQVEIDAARIRRVIDFYDLPLKKTPD